jgi:hypothetical protein
MESQRIDVFGVRLDLEMLGTDLWTLAVERFPPGWLPNNDRKPSRRYEASIHAEGSGSGRLSIDGGEPKYFSTVELLLDELESDMQMYVAEFATPYLFVHAGVVAWNGTAILLPGRSLAGKSTLVTSLVQAGATYYSDEYAVLDDQGRVWPYRRRVSLRNGPHGSARRLDLAPHDAPCEPLPISLIALLRYAPDGAWQVDRLAPAEAIMRLVDQTVAVRSRPEDTLAYLSEAVEHAVVIEGQRGEVDDAVPLILALAEEANGKTVTATRE